MLLPDLLSLHMLRSNADSTIISYHAGSEYKVTSAWALHQRLHAAGQSVYWNNILVHNDDPTFVFLILLWYVLYAWDETMEALYAHICVLVRRVPSNNITQFSTSNRSLMLFIQITYTLHKNCMSYKHIFTITPHSLMNSGRL